jgi:hypothetical protein
MWSTDEWQLSDILPRADSESAETVGRQPVTIDGQQVDEGRVKLRRRSGDTTWRAYLDGALLPPGTVIRSGETVVHRQPDGE